uniref:Uncharacterized protein n=1 Tax=Rhizophora mucronata TaxID=61149 RepID=A0A2P2Q3T7_RHIMU
MSKRFAYVVLMFVSSSCIKYLLLLLVFLPT